MPDTELIRSWNDVSSLHYQQYHLYCFYYCCCCCCSGNFDQLLALIYVILMPYLGILYYVTFLIFILSGLIAWIIPTYFIVALYHSRACHVIALMRKVSDQLLRQNYHIVHTTQKAEMLTNTKDDITLKMKSTAARIHRVKTWKMTLLMKCTTALKTSVSDMCAH